MSKAYLRLKLLVSDLLNNETISTCKSYFYKDEKYTESDYRGIVRKLNNIKFLTKISKEENKKVKDYFDNLYFDDKKKNITIISSIAHFREPNAFEVLDYIFKKVPKNIISKILNSYSKNFDKNIIKLLDEDKFKYFGASISENNEATKNVYRIRTTGLEPKINIVPLVLFLHEASWFVCYYDIKKSKLSIIDSINVTFAEKTTQTCTAFIPKNSIDKNLNDYVENNSSTINTSMVFWVRPELINIFINNKLIDYYEVYESKNWDSYKKYFQSTEESKVNINQKIELSKVNLNKKDNEEYTLPLDEVEFYIENTKKYFFLIRTTQKKIDYIKRNYDGIEYFSIDDYTFI